MTDSDDRPTRAEAEDDMRDNRTQLEKLLDLNAWFTRTGGGSYSVGTGYPPSRSILVSSIEVARALVAILNLTDPTELQFIMTTLLRAYGEKCVALEHYVPELDDEDPDRYESETEWGDSSDQYDPF